MPLIFAALSPHPPLLIPEVGKDDLLKVKSTRQALEQLASDIAEADPEVIVIMSPHGLIYHDAFNVNAMATLRGDFKQFDAPGATFSYKNDLDLVASIVKKADKDQIKVVPFNNEHESYELDHGTLVPLYFLTSELGSAVQIVPMTYSYSEKTDHFIFGQMLGEIFKNYPKRVAFIASGDMSHRILENSAGGQAGKKFDNTVVESLKQNDPLEILEIDINLREQAGECGYNSLVTLLGVIDQKKYIPEVLSYEAPFGVGYLVCNFKFS